MHACKHIQLNMRMYEHLYEPVSMCSRQLVGVFMPSAKSVQSAYCPPHYCHHVHPPATRRAPPEHNLRCPVDAAKRSRIDRGGRELKQHARVSADACGLSGLPGNCVRPYMCVCLCVCVMWWLQPSH